MAGTVSSRVIEFLSSLETVTKKEVNAYPFQTKGSAGQSKRMPIAFREDGSGTVVGIRVNLNQTQYENLVDEEFVVYYFPFSAMRSMGQRDEILSSKRIAIFIEHGPNNYAWGFGDIDPSHKDERGENYIRIRRVSKWRTEEGRDETPSEPAKKRKVDEISFFPSSDLSPCHEVRYMDAVWGSNLEVRWVMLFQHLGFDVMKPGLFDKDVIGKRTTTSYTPDFKLVRIRLFDMDGPVVNVYVDVKPPRKADSSFLSKCGLLSDIHNEHILLLEGEPDCPFAKEGGDDSYPSVLGMNGTLWEPTGKRVRRHQNVVLMKKGSDPPFLSSLRRRGETRHLHPHLLSAYEAVKRGWAAGS